MSIPLADLFAIYVRRGNSRYGDEHVTELEHALQTAELATREGAPLPLVAAALFHDIGHLSGGFGSRPAGAVDRHELQSVKLLMPLFPEEVWQPVRLHVEAKRYLCATEPGYIDKLSAQSLDDLDRRGGPMSSGETDVFSMRPHSAAALRLRRWDDDAKQPGAPTAGLPLYYRLFGAIETRRK